MNKSKIGKMSLIGLSLLTVMLAGCGVSATQDDFAKGRSDPRPALASVFVWTDSATGCQYLHRMDSRAGITPRLGTDGKPMCGVAR